MTSDHTTTSEQQLAQASNDLQALRQDLRALEQRVLSLERSSPAAASHPPEPIELPSEDASVWSLVGRSRVLPRVAMVSFAMVIALVLRTLTDSAVIGGELGVVLGFGYAASLVALGWGLLKRERPGRNVLPVCGALLLCSVVLESHAGFGLLTAASANWILLVALLSLSTLGLRYRSNVIVGIGVLACAVTAVAVDFPHPSYPHTAAVVLAGNVVGFIALRKAGMEWLAWLTFGLALLLWGIWGFQLNAALRAGEALPPEVHDGWFLPLLALFAVVFAVFPVTRATRPAEPSGAFLAFLPTANLVWAYLAARAVVAPSGGDAAALAAIGLGVSVAHLGLAAWLSRGRSQGAAAVTAFAVAGAVLFTWTSPDVIGNLALPIWSALALGLFACSRRCGNGGLRLTSYLLQAVACTALASSGLFHTPPSGVLVNTVAAALISALAATHYFLARRQPPSHTTWIRRIDRNDRAAILTLWAATVAAFGLLQATAYQLFAANSADVDNVFLGTQSVIINVSCILLMIWGIRIRSGEILATAALVAVIAGLKVVGSDLLTGEGLPLVLSVASFGIAAAIGSLVLGKWLAHRPEGTEESTQ